MAQLEALIAPLAIPPRSPALHGLWVRLLTDRGPPPAGGKGPSHFAALQMEGLYRSGLIDQMSQRLGPEAGARLEERGRSWRAFAAARGLRCACVDLAAPPLAELERELGPALAGRLP